jgi:dolichol-phosphate mannosyltransferase
MTVVLSNDGSTEATLATAHAWQRRLPLKGPGAGLRALVEYAATNGTDDDVLVIMDCDDTQIRRRSKRCSHGWQKALT